MSTAAWARSTIRRIAETVHVPWIMRFPDRLAASDRSPALVQPCDFAPTLVDWLGLPVEDERSFGRSVLPLVRGDVESLRNRALVAGRRRSTRHPHARPGTCLSRRAVGGHGAERSADSVGGRAELFAKPDDRWEVNDVADRCPTVVDLLRDALAQASHAPVEATDAALCGGAAVRIGLTVRVYLAAAMRSSGVGCAQRKAWKHFAKRAGPPG